MRSRTMREGSVGLVILAGIALFTGVGLWLRGFNPGNRSFTIFIEFGNSAGIQPGAIVRFRGVNVGKIVAIRPSPNKVEVEVQISPADVIIPRDVQASVNQSGLISQTMIELTPKSTLTATVTATPLDKTCNADVILCDQSRLQGELGVSVDELIRASVRFADLYSDPVFFDNVNTVLKSTSAATAEVIKLSRDLSLLSQSARSELKTFSASAASISRTADKIAITADQVNNLIASNRATLVSTLDNLSQTSSQLRSTVGGFNKTLNRVDQSQLLQNLETLTANAAKASANLKTASDSLTSPANLLMLQQTLDSARATFQNAQKITADLDELTGDPTFRNNLKNLVNGLSNLVSSTRQLHQQTQTAQILAPIAAAVQEPQSPETTEEPEAIASPAPSP